MGSQLTMLIDAASLVYRALFAVPDSIRAPDGTLVNAAYGFLGMLERLVRNHDPGFICCALDDDWRPQWRVDLIDSYKAMRAEEGSAQEEAEDLLAPQLEILTEILAGCGIAEVGHPGAEAEDVIGTLAERAPERAAVVSGDRDLFQLVRDPDIYVLYPRKGVTEMDVVNEAFIEKKYGIPGRAYADFAVLRGDPSDGLPGVKGVGEKLATGLIARYGSVQAVIEAAEGSGEGVALGRVRRDLDYVRRAVQVVAIPRDLAIPEVDLTRPRSEPSAEILALADEHALGGQVRRLGAALAGKGSERATD